MKKSYLFGMMAATMFFASSCQNELDSTSLETSVVSFNLGTPEIASRAFSDGTMATKLQYAVYNEAGEELTALTKDDESIAVGQTKNVKLQLTTGNTYSIIFWAANADAPYTVNFADKTMSVNYDKALSNDEVRDAFFARRTFEVKGNQTETIELKRPFAQLNIGTNDYTASTKAGYTVTQSYVEVPVYTTLNLFDGTVSGQETRKFGYAAIPSANETFPVSDYEYLSMNYLLVGAEQELVDVKFGYTNGTTAKERIVGSVPVQRNHRTNIYGQLITSNVDVNVEIKPEYEEGYDVNLPNPTIVYNNATFEDALNDANVSVINLEGAISYANTEAVSINKNITINANGKTIQAGAASSLTPSIAVSGEYEVTINNANVEGGFIGAYFGANVVVNGGSLRYTEGQSGRNCFYAASNTDKQSVITIKDVDVNMANANGNSYLCAHGNAIIYVEGGNFYGKPIGSSHPYVKEEELGTYTGKVIISGGTFNFDPSTWKADGCTVTNNGDGTWTVSK